MLKAYVELLQSLLQLLSHGSLDFASWKTAMKLTAMILLSSIGFILAVVTVVAIPVVVYRRGYKKIVKDWTVEDGEQEYQKRQKQWQRFRIVYWLVFICLYVPFMIPTVLLFL